MKRLLSLGSVVIGILALLLVVVTIASESGEVVVLNTRNDEGIGGKDTRLWIVDHAGSSWLRAGSTDSSWYRRLSKNPKVTLRRGDETIVAVAEPKPAETAKINALMNQKYGWADDLIGFLFGRDDSIAIKLNKKSVAVPNSRRDPATMSEMELDSPWESESE